MKTVVDKDIKINVVLYKDKLIEYMPVSLVKLLRGERCHTFPKDQSMFNTDEVIEVVLEIEKDGR